VKLTSFVHHFTDTQTADHTGSVQGSRGVKAERLDLVPNDEVDLNLTRSAPSSTHKISGGETTESADQSSSSNDLEQYTTVWVLQEGDRWDLMVADEGEIRNFDRQGRTLREAWEEQLNAFDKKNIDWPDKSQSGGCVRSTLWNGGKCYLTKKSPGFYACRTCWNTNPLCVAWDERMDGFRLRRQYPAAMAKDEESIGQFDVENFLSMRAKSSNNNLPPYWSSEVTL
jgi:hypothetical protein